MNSIESNNNEQGKQLYSRISRVERYKERIQHYKHQMLYNKCANQRTNNTQGQIGCDGVLWLVVVFALREFKHNPLDFKKQQINSILQQLMYINLQKYNNNQQKKQKKLGQQLENQQKQKTQSPKQHQQKVQNQSIGDLPQQVSLQLQEQIKSIKDLLSLQFIVVVYTKISINRMWTEMKQTYNDSIQKQKERQRQKQKQSQRSYGVNYNYNYNYGQLQNLKYDYGRNENEKKHESSNKEKGSISRESSRIYRALQRKAEQLFEQYEQQKHIQNSKAIQQNGDGGYDGELFSGRQLQQNCWRDEGLDDDDDDDDDDDNEINKLTVDENYLRYQKGLKTAIKKHIKNKLTLSRLFYSLHQPHNHHRLPGHSAQHQHTNSYCTKNRRKTNSHIAGERKQNKNIKQVVSYYTPTVTNNTTTIFRRFLKFLTTTYKIAQVDLKYYFHLIHRFCERGKDPKSQLMGRVISSKCFKCPTERFVSECHFQRGLYRKIVKATNNVQYGDTPVHQY